MHNAEILKMIAHSYAYDVVALVPILTFTSYLATKIYIHVVLHSC